MLIDFTIIFVICVFLFFIISVFLMDENPQLSIPFIIMGLISCALSAVSFWNVEYFYTSYNTTHGNSSGVIYSTTGYMEPYSYLFVAIGFLFVMLFFRAGFNIIRESQKQKGKIKYK